MNVKSITCKNTTDALAAGVDPIDIVAEVARRIKKKNGKMTASHRRILAACRPQDDILDTIADDSDAMSGHDVTAREATPEVKGAVYLREYVAGLSYGTIAARYGVGTQTVSQQASVFCKEANGMTPSALREQDAKHRLV